MAKDWKDEYLRLLSERNTPMRICKEMKIPYDRVKKARKDPDFVELENEAKLLYQENLYEEVYEKCGQNPTLVFKFAEKVVDALKVEPSTLINIDASEKTVLGISQEECFNQTKKLLENFKGKQRRIQTCDGAKALIQGGGSNGN